MDKNRTSLPTLESNFTPVPVTYLQSLFRYPCSAEEIVAMLFCLHRGYGWQSNQGAVNAKSLSRSTWLSPEQAASGLARAAAQGYLLALPSGCGEMDAHSRHDPSTVTYLLNTEENRKFLEAYCEADFDTAYPANEEAWEDLHASDPPNISRRPPSVRGPQPDETPPGDMLSNAPRDGGTPHCVEEPQFPGMAGEAPDRYGDTDTVRMSAQAPADIDTPPPADTGSVDSLCAEAHTSVSSGPVPPAGIPANAYDSSLSGRAPGKDQPSRDTQLPYDKRTIDLITKMLGRPMGKSERERLFDLGATDAELIGAMSSLLEKTKDVYSSDLIIYEYERQKTRDRQAEKYEKARAARNARIERMRKCSKCAGLGYVFIGVNNIRECDCRKGGTE